jgi:hypothetical protein
MADELAFTLTDDFADMVGGTLADPEGRTIDLAELLRDTEDGNVDGIIVTGDEFLKNTLNSDFRFEQVDVPESYHSGPDQTPAASTLRAMRKPELQKAYTSKYGQPAPEDATVQKLLHLIDPETFPDPDGPGGEAGPTDLQPDGTPTAALDHADDEPKED